MAHPIIGSKYCEIRVMFYIRLSNDEEKKSYFSSCPFWASPPPVGGMVNKPHLQVLIYLGKPLVCLDLKWQRSHVYSV